MSYDLHGAWDRNNKWLAPELNSYTNLTEITNALDLLWRNDINPEKVVLGLAFYARVFSATSPSCMESGCTFQSGGNAGVCSNKVGILLNSEIVEIMNDRQVKPTLDKDAAVKILKFDNNQWLTYDDADTFKLKAEFARGQCLGGVMVWAVSYDLPYGNYSSALGEVANRKVKALAMSTVTDELETRKVHQQCKWINCFENCPAAGP
jgi:GH18 family chitinase